LLCATLLLTGCGGGGGGGGSTPSTPQPVNNAPTVSINAISAVNEGETFQIDASGSSDPDAGDTLTFSIAQTSGSTVATSMTGTGIFEVTTVRVPIDETLSFDVSVSDGRATSTGSVSVDLRNVPSQPTFRMAFDPSSDLNLTFGGDSYQPKGIFSTRLSGEAQFGVVAESLTPRNGAFPDAIFFLEPAGSTYSVRQSNFFDVNVASYDLLVVQDIFGSADDDFAVVLSDTGEVILYGRDPSPSRNGLISNYSNQSANDPCAITFADLILASNGVDMVVGKRGGGVDFFRNEIIDDPSVFLGRGSYSIDASVLFGSEVCMLFDSQPPASSGRTIPDIIAVDTQSGEIATIVDGGANLSVNSTVAGSIDRVTGQQLMFWEAFDQRGASGLQAVAVFSDGAYSGDHSAYIISRDTQGTTVVEMKSWREGQPTDLAIGDADEDGDADIVIISEQNSEAIVFAQTSVLASGEPVFADAAFFDTGVGATGIAALPNGALAGDFFVSFRDAGTIRSFTAN